MDIPAGTRVGGKIREGKDRFQAFSVPCNHPDSAIPLVELIVKSCQLRKASHVSWALRLQDGGNLREARNDGGESGSGKCILDVMRKINSTNVLVIVARWYGGKHLGGLRFRIYRKLTAELLKT